MRGQTWDSISSFFNLIRDIPEKSIVSIYTRKMYLAEHFLEIMNNINSMNQSFPCTGKGNKYSKKYVLISIQLIRLKGLKKKRTVCKQSFVTKILRWGGGVVVCVCVWICKGSAANFLMPEHHNGSQVHTHSRTFFLNLFLACLGGSYHIGSHLIHIARGMLKTQQFFTVTVCLHLKKTRKQ